MKKNINLIKILLLSGIIGILINKSVQLTVKAYAPERKVYTKAEINEAYNKYLNNPSDPEGWAPNKIIFNSIKDSVIGHEFNFVGARECVLRDDGRCEGKTNGQNVWAGDDITVEDGKTYIVRLYVHNNNPYGLTEEEKKTASEQDIKNSDLGTAENVRVAFSIPYESSNQVTINGFVRADNSEDKTYIDYVNFNSATGNPFHLEYVYGSALLENNGIGKGGLKLSDDVYNTVEGTKIGYDALDGRVPGCYQFDNFITIQVKVVFDYDFTIKNEVRLADDEDKTWHSAVEAQVGDVVEFLIGYYNNSDLSQSDVAIRDYLPKNLEYIEGSTILRNSNHLNGVIMNSNKLTDGGIMIGGYGKKANAYVTFKAKVVDNSLIYGTNSLANWAQGGVGFTVIEDSATVKVQKGVGYRVVVVILIMAICACLVSIILSLYKIYCWKKSSR